MDAVVRGVGNVDAFVDVDVLAVSGVVVVVMVALVVGDVVVTGGVVVVVGSPTMRWSDFGNGVVHVVVGVDEAPFVSNFGMGACSFVSNLCMGASCSASNFRMGAAPSWSSWYGPRTRSE